MVVGGGGGAAAAAQPLWRLCGPFLALSLPLVAAVAAPTRPAPHLKGKPALQLLVQVAVGLLRPRHPVGKRERRSPPCPLAAVAPHFCCLHLCRALPPSCCVVPRCYQWVSNGCQRVEAAEG